MTGTGASSTQPGRNRTERPSAETAFPFVHLLALCATGSCITAHPSSVLSPCHFFVSQHDKLGSISWGEIGDNTILSSLLATVSALPLWPSGMHRVGWLGFGCAGKRGRTFFVLARSQEYTRRWISERHPQYLRCLHELLASSRTPIRWIRRLRMSWRLSLVKTASNYPPGNKLPSDNLRCSSHH